ncbi:MAG: response regulator transcription factor [Bacteroidales bacterium]
MEIIRVFIVDDHNLFRNGLKLLLNTSSNIRVTGEADNGKQFLDCLPDCLTDVVLMDIDMPVMDGITATREAIQRYPDLKIITLSMFGEEEYYFKMIDAGARGFLLKNSDISELRNAIQTVMEGRTYFSEELLLSVVKNIRTAGSGQKHSANLSDREIEVLQQICLGLSNQEIAEVLHISKRTVDKHRANLLEKTNSKNTANLVIFAMKHKLVEL